MMGVLVLAEVNGSELDIDATAKTVAAAKLLGEVTVLCASNDSSQAAKEAAKLQGVSKVLCLDAPSFAHGLAEPLTEFIVSLSADFEHIIGPATNYTKNIQFANPVLFVNSKRRSFPLDILGGMVYKEASCG